jgi:hypothetical protein
MARVPPLVPILWISEAQREDISICLRLQVQVHKMMTSYMEFMMVAFPIWRLTASVNYDFVIKENACKIKCHSRDQFDLHEAILFHHKLALYHCDSRVRNRSRSRCRE